MMFWKKKQKAIENRQINDEMLDTYLAKEDLEIKHRNNYISSGAVRKATAYEYAEFLKGYFERGGKPTHFYSYFFDVAGIYTATRNTVVPDGCGALAFNVIAPKGYDVRFAGRKYNHGNIYGEKSTPSWVPLYPDIICILGDMKVEIPKTIY